MAKSPFIYNTHDLPRRPGEMREVRLVIDLHEPLGFEVMAITQDEPIDIEMKIESVAEGVLVTANVLSEAVGECGRCLDEVVFDIDENFVELFEYAEDPRQARKKEKKKSQRAKDAEEAEKLDDEDELRQMDGDEIDLEGPIRDAIILNLPINPLCSPDCLGLCPDCGEKWENLPEDHAHEVIDARWAGLAGLKLPEQPE